MRRELKIKQHDLSDCGAACLGSIGMWYGINLPLVKIREFCGCTQNGITIKGIIDGANKMGLSAKAFKSPLKQIDPLFNTKLPLIALVKNNLDQSHYLVIYKIRNNKITVMDPSFGDFITYSYNQFTNIWSGYIITFSYLINFSVENEKISFVDRLFLIAYSFKKDLFLSLAGAVFLTLIGIGNSVFLQILIDKILPTSNVSALLLVSFTIILLTLSYVLINFSKGVITLRSSLKIDISLILTYIRKIFKLPSSILSSYKVGDLNSRISDAVKVRSVVIDGIITILVCSCTILVTITLMFLYNKSMAIYMLCFIPLYIGIFVLSLKITKKQNREITKAGAAFEVEVIDSFNCISSIRYNNAESFILNKIENKFTDFIYKIEKNGYYNNMLNSISDLISRSSLNFILIYGSFCVLRDKLTLGELVSFYTLCAYLISPITTLISINGLITQASIASDRLFELIEVNKEEEFITNKENMLLDKTNAITLINVNFSYPGQKVLFRNLNLKIIPGSITAIIGQSGCGKSTLAKLLVKEYIINDGEINWGYCNINSISSKEWRKMAVLVPQRGDIYNCSLIENIILNHQSPNKEFLEEICINLNLMELINKLQVGLLTSIKNSSLSGGEVQKITLARAIYKDSPILILDEPSANLDTKSEHLLFKYLIKLKNKGKMILLITHKKSNLKYADHIIQLGAQTV